MILEEGLFKNKYRIKSCRYEGWDYANEGFYFVTICTRNREIYFGDIINGKIFFSNIGKIAERYWTEIPRHFPFVQLDEFIIMPNHIHGIIVIKYNNGIETQNFASLPGTEYGNKFGSQSKNLSSIIRGFKIGVKRYATMYGINFAWQERFHDHIIRNEDELIKIRQYIIDNHEKWEFDRNNPNNY